MTKSDQNKKKSSTSASAAAAATAALSSSSSSASKQHDFDNNYNIKSELKILNSNNFNFNIQKNQKFNNFIKSEYLSKSTENILAESKLVNCANINNLNETNSNKYGELLVLGYNGYIPPATSNSASTTSSKTHNLMLNSKDYSNRRKSKFILKKREKANGVRPHSQHTCQSTKEVDELMKSNSHAVSYTLARNHTVVVQYIPDENVDMFQIGRSSEAAIDFIVLDTPQLSLQQMKHNNTNTNHQSTISRFACRITIERTPPHTARIYAAGFDTLKHIFLGEKATKWKNEKGELDGVTTNGVLIMHPTNGFKSESTSNEWMEVSVCGAVFNLNESRLTPRFNEAMTSNVLRDGTLIDLCGATLLWRSSESLVKTPTKHYLEMHIENLNRSKPLCPVGLKTLVFPSSSSFLQQQQQQQILLNNNNNQRQNKLLSSSDTDRKPMVYLECGHVHGQHDWGVKGDNERECPLCRKVGPYVQLQIGLEPSFYCDNEFTNKSFKPYALKPCAHMASEVTCKYWSKIFVPQGTTQGLISICPFCSIPLCKKDPFIKLIFQENIN